MTQPDGEIPDSAIASLAAHAAKDQEDWEAELEGRIRDPFEKFTDFFASPLKGFLSALTGIDFGQTPAEVWGDIVNAFIRPLNFFAELVGGFISSFHIPILDPSKILNLPGLFDDVLDGFTGIFNGWFGSGGTGTVAEVVYTMESIKDAVINGYTVSTFTSSTAGWTVPPHAEMTAILISGGQNGSAVSAGVGGLHGSFFVTPIDLTGITTLDIQIGTAGNLTYVREAAGTAHTGAVVVQSKAQGSVGGSAINGGLFGLTPTNSLPGSGGNGGGQGPDGDPPTPGQASSLAAGGAAGSNGNFGTHGSAGGTVSAGSQVKCGGGGGGGGGGARVVLNGGGNGGAGGYPGGGGGGRGQGYGGGANGANGPGAPGVCWLVYK